MSLLTPKQVAEKMGISLSMVYDLVANGEIEHIRLRRDGSKKPIIRFAPRIIEAWLQRRTVLASTKPWR